MDRYEQLLADGTLTPEAQFGTPVGTGYVTDAKTGHQILAHLPPTPAPEIRYVHLLAPTTPAQVQPRDPWLGRILAGSGGAALVIGVTGAVAPQLQAVGKAMEMGGIGIGALVGGIALVKGLGPKVNVTINNSNTGASSSSTSSSASGWKSSSST